MEDDRKAIQTEAAAGTEAKLTVPLTFPKELEMVNINEVLMVREDLKRELVTILNKVFAIKPIPFTIETSTGNFNRKFAYITTEHLTTLRRLEEEYSVVGLANVCIPHDGISVASIIATITAVLTQDRLTFELTADGYIKGVKWYSEIEKRKDGKDERPEVETEG